MEMIVASLVGLVVLLGLSSADFAKERIRFDVRDQTGVGTPEQLMAGLAAIQLARSLENADRLNFVGGAADNVQVRVVVAAPGASFDDPASYRWEQYRYDAANDVLIFYGQASGCTGRRELATEVTAFSVAWQPAVAANRNRAEYAVAWGSGRVYSGEVVLRGGNMTGIDTGLQTPGGADEVPPPVACTT